ncbi:DUF2628 domain-containing protein [Flavobacterium sp. SUN052]|uniref:DUF2628 domain-containing protein n=1 Tax=Flavobacterium sp. SUN052 TaxID=3002441 RepID=UPI00237E7C71|nr:DUF2628 domain-containing protein [Flavobacterium sp. SUN052]MEC4003619.1 DUF2628 domain-containing protein [Flavobacterium sp. SUN052]
MEKLYFEIFFKKSIEYYIDKVEKFEKGKRISFNLPAFLFGIFWILYRKMYKQSLLIFGIILIFTTAQQILFLKLNYSIELNKLIQFSINITLCFFVGFFGNWIYIKHAKKKINEALTKFDSDEILKKKYIAKTSGTSILTVISVLFCFILIMYLSEK